MKKYIVDNLANQTLTGSLRIDGSLRVTDGTQSTSTYKALLTQTQQITGTSLGNFDGGLIIGEEYTINNYVDGDDFSNIATVTSGTINTTGCVFQATGTYPTNFSNGSSITSSGNFVVEVLENNLGFNISWVMTPFGGFGYYMAFTEQFGPLYNSFPRNKTIFKVLQTTPWNYPGGSEYLQMWTSVDVFDIKDDTLILSVFDLDSNSSINDTLYYTPVEISIKQDLDPTPISLIGTIVDSYPINNPSVRLIRGGQILADFYADNTSNNISELVTTLNTDTDTNYLGTYFNDGENILLNMAAGLKRQFAEENELTFEVYND